MKTTVNMSTKTMTQDEISDDNSIGLKFALCALSFFRRRNDRRPAFKTSNKRNMPTVSARGERVAMARKFIRRAREAGFRGSIRAAVGVID
jgi:hypothetical protein